MSTMASTMSAASAGSAVRPIAREEVVFPPTGPRAFLSYVHSMRGLAILAVVAVHVADALNFGHSTAFSERAIYALFGNASVLFVFVSGFLFQHLSGRFRYSTYVTKRLLTIVLPYLVISLPVLLHQYWRHDDVFRGTEHLNPWLVAARALLTGSHMRIPFWYVPMIVPLYVAAPLLLKIDRRRTWYGVIVPLLVMAMLLHRSRGHRLVWQSTLYFLPAYLTGMWASAYRERILSFIGRYRWVVGGGAFTLWLYQLTTHRYGGPIFSLAPFSTEAGIVDLDLLTKLIASLLALELLRRYDMVVRQWFQRLAETSFGIFFVHGPVLAVLQGLMRRRVPGPAHYGVGLWLLGTVGVISISMGSIRLVQRLLGERSRYVIGC